MKWTELETIEEFIKDSEASVSVHEDKLQEFPIYT